MSSRNILKNLPRYLWDYVVGLLLALANDFVLTSILLAGVASGFWLGIAAGFAIFFMLYVFLRVIGNVAEAIGYGLRGLTDHVTHPPQTLEVVEREAD